jgi:hypothetical protein
MLSGIVFSMGELIPFLFLTMLLGLATLIEELAAFVGRRGMVPHGHTRDCDDDTNEGKHCYPAMVSPGHLCSWLRGSDMNHPIRTLLRELFIDPALRLLRNRRPTRLPGTLTRENAQQRGSDAIVPSSPAELFHE